MLDCSCGSSWGHPAYLFCTSRSKKKKQAKLFCCFAANPWLENRECELAELAEHMKSCGAALQMRAGVE